MPRGKDRWCLFSVLSGQVFIVPSAMQDFKRLERLQQVLHHVKHLIVTSPGPHLRQASRSPCWLGLLIASKSLIQAGLWAVYKAGDLLTNSTAGTARCCRMTGVEH